MKTEVKKSIFTLIAEVVRIFAQQEDRLISADRMIASLNVAIQEEDRETSQITNESWTNPGTSNSIYTGS